MLKSKITGKQNYSLRFANVRNHKLTPRESTIPLSIDSVSCIGLCWNQSIETSQHEKEFSTQDKNLTWKIKFLTSDENLNLRIKFSTWENLDFRKRPEIKGAFDLDLKIWIFGFPIIEREIWKKRILSRIS